MLMEVAQTLKCQNNESIYDRGNSPFIFIFQSRYRLEKVKQPVAIHTISDHGFIQIVEYDIDNFLNDQEYKDTLKKKNPLGDMK